MKWTYDTGLSQLVFLERISKLQRLMFWLIIMTIQKSKSQSQSKIKIPIKNLNLNPMSAPKSYRRSQCQRELIKNCAQRYNFFNNRIASEWNALPDQVINSETVNQFKACLDRHSCHSGSSTVDLLCGI